MCFDIYTVPYVWTLLGQSFAVQFGDHLRTGDQLQSGINLRRCDGVRFIFTCCEKSANVSKSLQQVKKNFEHGCVHFHCSAINRLPVLLCQTAEINYPNS